MNTRCRPRNRGNAELKCIISHSLSNGVRTISEWYEFLIGTDKAFPLQMQPDFVAHLKLVWHPMLIMALLVISIGSVKYIMDLLVDVLNVLNEVVCLVSFELDMS